MCVCETSIFIFIDQIISHQFLGSSRRLDQTLKASEKTCHPPTQNKKEKEKEKRLV